MNSSTLIPKKYAQAFLNVFMDKIDLETYKNLLSLSSTLSNHKEIKTFLKLPQLAAEKKEKFLRSLASIFELPSCFNSLISLLVSYKRAAFFQKILSYIILIYKNKTGITNFHVKSTVKLTTKQLNSLNSFLAKKINKTVVLSQQVDPSLIAGIRAQSDHYLWEYSIAEKLRTVNMSPME